LKDIKCIIIGRTNVGKTLFAINFSNYLGCKKINLESIYFDNSRTNKTFTRKEAILQLTDKEPHKTRCLNKFQVTIPVGKKKRQIAIVDSTGIIDNIHPEPDIRKAISQTLSIIKESKIVLHIIDVSAMLNKKTISSLGEVDYHIASFCQMKTGYAILANKIDILGSEVGLKKLRSEFPGNYILPISALHKRGFKEVKNFVVRNAQL